MKFERRSHAAGLFTIAERRRWKSTPQPPTPPDPAAVAKAQTGTNVNTAIANSTLGNINTVTPFGSSTFSQTGGYTDPTTGQFVPSSTNTTTLNPALAGILSGTENLATNELGTANTLNNQINTAIGTPINTAGANQNMIAGGPQALYGPASTAAYNEASSFLDPQWQQQQKDLQDQLSQRGFDVGSPGYSNAMTQFDNAKTQAYQAASNAAVNQGINAGQGMFGLAVQGQNQQLGQQLALQNQPFNLLSQLYGGSPIAGAVGRA
jgi:hypothetical protein